MTVPLRRLLIVATLARVAAFAQAPAEIRQWTDRNSGTKIEAAMVSADPVARTVTIQRKDGQSFTLPVARLVDADMIYIKDRLAKLAAPAPAPTPAPAPAPAPGAPPAPAPKGEGKAKEAPPAGPVGQPAPPRPTVAITPVKKYKFPAGNQIMGTVKKPRPRLLMNAEGFAGMKARLATDPTTKALFDHVKATADAVLQKPELTQVRGEAARGGIGPGEKMIFRMAALGTLHHVDADPRWQDYAIREMISLSSFTNWHPQEMKSNASFLWGMAIGYDMFRTGMTADQEKKIKAAIVELGMEPMIANFKGEPLPPTSLRPEAGQAPNTKVDPKTARKRDADRLPDAEEMVAAGALLHAAIALADEAPNIAGPASTIAAKVLGEGVGRFAPDGVWPEGLHDGDEVLDILGSLMLTLRATAGNDFGLSTLEGIPQASLARLHLTGPTGRIFNYGDTRGDKLPAPWVTNMLAANYGNPGVPAVVIPKGAANSEIAGLNIAGTLLYHSPYMGGYGTPDALDAAFPGAQIATLRSAANDPKAMYVAIKGGDNDPKLGGQLDLGTFILDAGGERWGIDLGTEEDRTLGNRFAPAKFKLHRETTLAQNVVRFAKAEEKDKDDDKKKKAAPKGKGKPPEPEAPPGSQPFDAKAAITAFSSTPERGVAIVDLKDAYKKTKDYQRGVMMNRGAAPNVVVQDEMELRGTASPDWVMHTKATVTTDGGTAKLSNGKQTLTMKILSPAGASFFAEALNDDALKGGNQQVASFKGITALKIPLNDAKGKQTISVAFALGDAAPEVAVVPMAQWVQKKR